MENYVIKKEVFVHETGAFKSFIAMNKKTRKDYLLTNYDLTYYKDKKIQICQKIISICQTIKLYRCCQVFFDHEIYTLESIRPSNIGTFLRRFTVVEPFPMVSLGDYFDSGKINVDTVINGFIDIYRILATLHFLNIGYGCLSPLNIIVTNGNFSLRPPNLSKYQCSCTPPPLISRNRYRFKTEIVHYPHDKNLKNSKRVDCLCYGYLLCDYILYYGRNISFLLQKKYRQLNLYFKKFSLPPFIMTFLKPDHDIFLNEAVQRNLRKFLSNRRNLLELYTKHKFVDPAKFNEKSTRIKRPQITHKKSPSKKKRRNIHFQNYGADEQYDINNFDAQIDHQIFDNENSDPNKLNNYDFNTDYKHHNSEVETSENQIVINEYSDVDNAEFYETGNDNKSKLYIQKTEPELFSRPNYRNDSPNNQVYKNNLKIDQVDCYTIYNQPDSINHNRQISNDKDNNNLDNDLISQNVSDTERYSAYSDAANYYDSDESFSDANELNQNIADYNILDSSGSDFANNVDNKNTKTSPKRDEEINIVDNLDYNFINHDCFKFHSPPKNNHYDPVTDSESDFALPSFINPRISYRYIVKFKLEYDKTKFSNKKFSIQIFTGSPPKSKLQTFLTINKTVADIKHHRVNKEIYINEDMLKRCQKEGITVCVMFNNAVHKDTLHLCLRNISFIPFYDNNLNRIFSVQTTFEEAGNDN